MQYLVYIGNPMAKEMVIPMRVPKLLSYLRELTTNYVQSDRSGHGWTAKTLNLYYRGKKERHSDVWLIQSPSVRQVWPLEIRCAIKSENCRTSTIACKSQTEYCPLIHLAKDILSLYAGIPVEGPRHFYRRKWSISFPCRLQRRALHSTCHHQKNPTCWWNCNEQLPPTQIVLWEYSKPWQFHHPTRMRFSHSEKKEAATRRKCQVV